MTSRDFAYWLQGFFEISGSTTLTEEQTKMIKNHLNMVFRHEIDPSFGPPKYIEELSKIHEGGKVPQSSVDLLTKLQGGTETFCAINC